MTRAHVIADTDPERRSGALRKPPTWVRHPAHRRALLTLKAAVVDAASPFADDSGVAHALTVAADAVDIAVRLAAIDDTVTP